MVRLQRPQHFDGIGFALIVHHLVMDPAEQDQVRWIVEVIHEGAVRFKALTGAYSNRYELRLLAASAKAGSIADLVHEG